MGKAWMSSPLVARRRAAAIFNPGFTSGLKLWLKADALALADGASVSSWTDSSSNGLNATQGTGTKQPTYRTNIVNSRPVVRFDGGDNLVTASVAAGTRDLTLVIVCKMTTSQDSSPLVNGTMASDGYGILTKYTGGTKQFVRGGQAIDASAVSSDTSWDILMLRAGDVQGTTGFYDGWSKGGLPLVSKVGTAVTPTGSTIIGSYQTSTLYFAGDIAEVCIWNRRLSLSEVNGLGSYLQSKYGVTWSNVSRLTPAFLVLDGDSQINSVLGGAGTTTGTKVAAAISASNVTYNVGVPSQTLLDMSSDAATEVDSKVDLVRNAVVVCWGGTNDLFFGATGTTTYNRMVSYCQARRSAGWKVIACTALPRSNSGTPAGYETERQTFNTSVRNNWSTFADVLCDIAGDNRIGDAGDELDTTYYGADKVHLNDTGRGIAANLIVASLATLNVS